MESAAAVATAVQSGLPHNYAANTDPLSLPTLPPNSLPRGETADPNSIHSASTVNTSPKRRHPSHRRDLNYPRKRAVTACLRCRGRKTKCDNQRPTCGFCASVNASCHYDDLSDHSS